MNIKSVKIKNFMGHQELDVADIGQTLTIRGANESGKSSLLKAIKCAFSTKGEKVDLIRNGSEFAEIQIEAGKIEVKRRVRPVGANDSLVVLQEGAELRKPQEALGKLFSSIQLNPLDFMELSSEKALEAVLSAFPLPPVADLLQSKTRIALTKTAPLDQINETIAAVMEDRRQMKKEEEGLRIQAETLLKGVPADFDPTAHAGESMEALVAEQRRAIAHNSSVQAAAEHRVRLANEIALLEGQLEEKRAQLKEIDAKGGGELVNIAKSNEAIAAFNEWRSQLASKEAAAQRLSTADALAEKIERKTKGLDWLRALPAQLLAESAPIDGVRINDGRLEVQAKNDGFVPFANASESARLYYAVKIAKAMAPADGLRAILVDGAERMDAARKAELRNLCAAEPAFQLIMAEVSDGPLSIGAD